MAQRIAQQNVVRRTRSFSVAALIGAVALVIAGCSTSTTQSENGAGGSDTLTVGTTDKVTVLDPAGAYNKGSSFIMTQVYPYLVEYQPGTPDIKPAIAESAEYVDPSTYQVKLKPGLKYANGHDLTSSDVKFSFDRQLNIKDVNGPSSLLSSLESVETPDDLTVNFKLSRENDQTFPLVLAGPAGPIVDEEVFSADELTSDQDIVDGKAFAGPYSITTYNFNQLVSLEANPDYAGTLGQAKTANVQIKYYSDPNNMKLDVQQGNTDVVYRSLSATDIEDLENDDSVTVHSGPGGEIRYIVFNFDTMPFGAKTSDPDPAKALAVRQAMADSIDREAISTDVYKGTYTPMFAFAPDGLPGADNQLKGLYGDGNGKPDAERAKQRLEDAGVQTPVEIQLQYNPDHYGPSSGDEYALVKKQLEDTGLFTVDLKSTEWVQYSKDRSADVYPVYQLGWFPDYADADNYLMPFFYNTPDSEAFLRNHFTDDAINEALEQQVSEEDADKRGQILVDIQKDLAQQLPTLPLLQGAQIAVSGNDVQGVDSTLDVSFQVRLALLSK